jgi:hypothetical protein
MKVQRKIKENFSQASNFLAEIRTWDLQHTNQSDNLSAHPIFTNIHFNSNV